MAAKSRWYNIRALAPLGGRRMVEYIIDALDQSGQIGRIIVAADGSQWEAAVCRSVLNL